MTIPNPAVECGGVIDGKASTWRLAAEAFEVFAGVHATSLFCRFEIRPRFSARLGSQWKALRRTFEFSDFAAAMTFVRAVARAAEKADHHPDIDIRWNKVTLALTSHDAGGITERDVALATRIQGLAGPRR